MKTCRKCKNEFKDEYTFCPKCGKPYDPSKKVEKVEKDEKVVESIKNEKPIENKKSDVNLSQVDNGAGQTFKKIGVVALYIFGGLIILASLDFADGILVSIVGIIAGLSCFKCIYTLLSDKTNLGDKTIFALRIVLPIILICVWGSLLPDTEESTTTKSTPTPSAQVEQKTEKQKTKAKVIYLKNTKAKDFYKTLCGVTGLREKNPSALFCNTIEYSSYDTNYQIEVGAYQKTDEIAYITITQLQAPDPTNAFMALNRLDYNGKDSAKLTDFITKNKGKKADIQIGDLKFSTWVSDTSGKLVLDARTPDYDNYILKCDE
ncbi:MAG: zinc ribbon domain-containing protein [Bacilli bacterium]|nr:zinc ribbon domain-containing protein [Bacilli bacterium]